MSSSYDQRSSGEPVVTSIAPVAMQDSKNLLWGGTATFYNMDSGNTVASCGNSFESFKNVSGPGADTFWGSQQDPAAESRKNGSKNDDDNIGFTVTMQDLIDCIVDESMRRPIKESNYTKTSEAMFRKMLSGERSWNINSCTAEPCADYQSRLENLAVLNNLIISMESKSASKSEKMGDTMVSQMKTRFASTPKPGSSGPATLVKDPSTHMPAPPSKSEDNSYSEEQNSDVFTDFPVRSSLENQRDSSGKMDYDSSSSAERSPEITSDSGSSLCNKCRSLKLGERCSCPDSNSRSSPSSSSQGSCESRNASPPSKTSDAGSTRKNSDGSGSSTDESYSSCAPSQTKLPPPPPLIAMTGPSKPGVWGESKPPAPSTNRQSSERQSSSSSSSREEIKHPKKRIKDRHFRETNGGDFSDSSGSGSSDSNGNSSDSQQSNTRHNFPQNMSQYQQPLHGITPQLGLFPNVPIVNTFVHGMHHQRSPFLRDPLPPGTQPAQLQTQASFGENLFRPFNELTLFGTMTANPGTTQVFMLPNIQQPPSDVSGLSVTGRNRYPLLQSICQAETSMDSSKTNFSSSSRYY